jgi:uncharacterized membrane protein
MKNLIEKFFNFVRDNIILDSIWIGSFFYTPAAFVAWAAMAILRLFEVCEAPKIETYILYSAYASIILYLIFYALTEYADERYEDEFNRLHPNMIL